MPSPHRIGDVLEVQFAQKHGLEFHSAFDLAVGVVGDADTIGLAFALQSCSDIDAIAKQIVAIGDDITNIDANAGSDLLVFRCARIAGGHTLLDRDHAAQCFNCAGELQQHAVARRIGNAPTVLSQCRVDEFLAMPPQGAKRAFLVQPHQPRVAHDIGRHDSRQFPLLALQFLLLQNRVSRECPPRTLAQVF